MITLYDYWRSSASYRVRIALGLAGAEWDSVPVNLVDGVQRSPDNLERNPQGLVPTIRIDDISLTQSLAIIEYLDEIHNLGLLPNTPLERARVRALAYAIAMEIHPVCNLRVAKFAVASSNGGITMKSWMQKFIGDGLKDFEAMLGDTPYCYANAVTLADICLVPQVYNAKRWEIDLTETPKLAAISERLEELPAFANAHPDRTPK